MEKNLRKLMMIFFVLAVAAGLRFGLEFAFNIIWETFDLSNFSGYLVRGAFLALFAIIWLSITIRSENPHQKLPWLLLLAFEPVVGTTLFLTFGRNFKKSLRYRRRPYMHGDRYITHEVRPYEVEFPLLEYDEDIQEAAHTAHRLSHHQPFIDQSHIEVLHNGEEFYPDLVQSIQEAEHFILFEFFILRSDGRGREIVDLLMQRAAEGIEVKIIIDALGSAMISPAYLRRIRRSNVEIIINDRIYFPLFNTRINFRNHRKIVVVDGKIGYTGGMNIANEYDNTTMSGPYFRDTQLRIEGAAVRSLTALFFKDYYYNTGRFIDDDAYYPDYSVEGRGLVQILQSGPDSDVAAIRNLYLKLILNAKRSIKIMTPYMALDQETLTAIKVAAQSGVDVEIIIPGEPDKYLVYKVTKAFVGPLLKDGVKIYQYVRGFAHAKVLIVDDKIASVGSYNLDNRSAVIDFEVTALISGASVGELLEDFEEDKQDSARIDADAWFKRPLPTRLFEGIMSIFSPII